MTFGAYSLSCVSLGLISLEDCNDASKELEGEIAQAKADLRSKGMDL